MSEQDKPRAIHNALPVGYRFNEFEIKEVIGGGGFGIIIEPGIISWNAPSRLKSLCPPRWQCVTMT